MLRRLAERPDSSRRLDLLRRLAEDASARSAAVLMDLTYRASRASDRRMAVQALAGVEGAVGDRYLFQVARANPWVSVRAAAIDELGRSDGDEVVPWLVNLAYNDVSPEVQKFTVSVLARLDRSGAGSGLLQIARSHPEDRVRDEAVYWLVQTGREDVLARLIESA
jgi:HEAT repeat protein